MKVNTDKAYLLGLLVGGGVLHGETLQIKLPYKKWGNLAINPSRAGGIAEDILSRLNPIWSSQYDMNVSYKVGTDWKILSNSLSDKLKCDLKELGLPLGGELRLNADLETLYPYLITIDHKKNFITGLVDTIGSLAQSHRRFVSDFQVISFEFKGSNFQLVKDITQILMDINCYPDQILWNHPNQHSGTCRYYKSWKKGFKVRVALDDYMLKGGFIFTSKQLSAQENKKLQMSGDNTTEGKPFKVSGRVTLHVDEKSDWLPSQVRGGHYIHNLHFYDVLNLPIPADLNLIDYINNFQEYFCPFTCLTKGDSKEINKIISSEDYLLKTSFVEKTLAISQLLEIYKTDKNQLIYGKSQSDGFPLSYILQGVAYIIAATKGERIKGKRVLGNFIGLIEENEIFKIKIKHPNKGTCLIIHNDKFACLVGYVNNDFNKTLINKIDGSKVYIREPYFDECIDL
jgi:hypothetical protein